MKKIILMSGAVIFLTVSVVFAQGMKEMENSKGSMMAKGMMGKGMMDEKGSMMGTHGMMTKMMEKSVVATSDGGIVVVMGNKLTKYDKDLNVVKEVELRMDMEGMQKMMSDMMEKCPMMKGMMGGMDKQSDKAQDTTPAASDEVDHASHH